MARTLVGILIGVGFVAAVVGLTLNQMRATCRVCIVYRGGQACESATAADRTEASIQARTLACARLSSGVTDGIQCDNTPPLSIECSE